MAEQMVNKGISYLSADINNTTTSITVTDGSVFPSSGNFRIIIESEILKVTARTGNTLTVERGSESTTAASHTKGDRVAAILTKEGITSFIGDFNIRSTWAAKPSAGIAGRQWWQSDGPYLGFDDGSQWHYKGLLGQEVFPPALQSWSWVNQSTATIDDSKGFSKLIVPGNSGNGQSLRVKSAPTPPYDITMTFMMKPVAGAFSGVVLGFRESSSAKLHLLQIARPSGTPDILRGFSEKWTNATTFSATYLTVDFSTGQRFNTDHILFKIRISDNNTDRLCQIATVLGEDFRIFHNVGRTDFLTADQVCFGLRNDSASGTATSELTLLSWEES